MSSSVELITLVKDAIFLYPKREDGFKEMIPLGTDEEGNAFGIEGFYLEDNELIFSNERPYVIYGYAGVPSEKQCVLKQVHEFIFTITQA